MKNLYLSRSLLGAIVAVLITACLSSQGRTGELPEYEVSQEGDYYVMDFGQDRFFVSMQPEYELGSGWAIDCPNVPGKGRLGCRVFGDDGGLLLMYSYSSPRPTAVCIFGGQYPGGSAQVQIDDGPVWDTLAKGCIPGQGLYDRLLSGKSVFTRRYDKSKSEHVDARSSLDGLHKAIEVLDRIRSK